MISKKSQLAIIGGIMINADHNSTDKFLPLKFEVRTKTKTEDLFEPVFGKRKHNFYR